MSKEVLEISVNIDEHFDISFSIVEGILGMILKFFEN
jgi:hypothetical protein